MRKGITTKGQIYDFRSYIDVDIEKEVENVKEVLEECYKKLIEITMIPKNRFK